VLSVERRVSIRSSSSDPINTTSKCDIKSGNSLERHDSIEHLERISTRDRPILESIGLVDQPKRIQAPTSFTKAGVRDFMTVSITQKVKRERIEWTEGNSPFERLDIHTFEAIAPRHDLQGG
jgi:hypothetical protein